MKVVVARHAYEMPADKFRQLLAIASEQVNKGIYGIRKGDYAELVNYPCKSNRQLKTARRAYQKQGFTVYANE